MSRADFLRQRHRSVAPRVAATSDPGITAPDDKRMDVPQPSAENFAMRVRETLMVMLGRQGDPMDRGITLRDLIDSGVVTINPGYSLGSGGGSIPIGGGGAASNVKPDLTPPPTVTGFRVTPSLTNIFFETDDPTWAMGHGYFVTNIYGAAVTQAQPNPTFDKAVQIFSFTGSVGSWGTAPNTTWALWAKWETRDGVESISPAGGTNGVQVTTGQDVDKLVAAMTGPGEPFKVVPVQMTLPDGSVVPAGTYTADAYIHNGEITTAKIANLAVKDAKIESLAVAKINAGAVTASRIQSPTFNGWDRGWAIDASGSAWFGQVQIKGAVYADSGYFYGDIHANSGYFNGDVSGAYGTFRGGIFGGNFDASGNYPPAGQAGYWLGQTSQVWGLRLGNRNNGQFMEIDGGGNIYAPGLQISGGSANFNGSISMDNGQATKLRITPSTVEVYQNGNLRVRMGVW